MIDVLSITKQPLVEDAINVCLGLVYGGHVKTNFQPTLLENALEVATDCPEKPVEFNLKVQRKASNQLVDTVCLVSGGADSTIAWYLKAVPRTHIERVKALYIDIGQNYASKEIDHLTLDLEIPFHRIEIIQKDIGAVDVGWKHIIPGRNFLFLTIAAEIVKHRGNIIFSIVDGEGYESKKGDKSEEFILKWQEWYSRVTGKEVNIITCVERTKAGWLKRFMVENDIDIIRYKTITCFSDEHGQCGKCQSCLRKYLSFMTNRIDICGDFNIHPMIGANQFVEKYKDVLNKALKLNNYSHYSLARCTEDLAAIEKAEMKLGASYGK